MGPATGDRVAHPSEVRGEPLSQGVRIPTAAGDLRVPLVLLRYLSGQAVVSISETDAYRAHLVQLLSVAGDGVGEVDDVEDLGAAEAGDLHGSHARQAR